MSSALDLDVRAGPLHGSALVQDYLAGAPALAPFYAAHPGSAAAYHAQAAEVERRLDVAARGRVAAAIRPLGDAAERLDRILGGDGFFVTTGQQPALFGGPVYTLYKVLAAIRLAAVLETELGRPVLALFWIGADDHDWSEANHTHVLDAERYVHRLAVDAAPELPPLPLAERVWGAGVERAVSEFTALLPAGAHSDIVAAHVRAAYTADSTVAASFTATMELLLRDRRVALVSSAHPAVRRAAVPVLLREAEHSSAHHDAVRRQTERLMAAGYGAQVPLTADASNLMLQDAHGRDRLMRDARGWRTRREQHGIDAAALLERIAAEPERFSPNVLLRPVVESALFPTLAYVAGPGELGYFAQIGCLFRAHGIAPPIVVARPAVTVVDAKVRRLLGKLGLDVPAVRRPFHELVSAVIRQEVPPAAVAALERLRRELHEAYGELMAATDEIDPTLRGPLTAARNWSTVRTHEAEKRIVRHLKRRNGILVEQLRKTASSLYPDGAPQERVLGALPLLARYGPAVVAQIEAALDMSLRPMAEWTGPDCDEGG